MSEDTVQRLMGLADEYAVCSIDYERQPSAHAKPYRLRMEAARSTLESALREVLKQPLGDALTGPGSSLQPQAASTAIPIATGEVQSMVSLGSRGTINLLAVERIEPRGEYPDEVTVVMKSGARFSVSAQAAGRPAKSDAMKAWSQLVARAARSAGGAGNG